MTGAATPALDHSSRFLRFFKVGDTGNPAGSAITTLRPGAETSAPFVTGAPTAFSPDGRWVAYAAGTAGERQVFIQPYPDASAGKWQVSGTGGAYPRWRADGRELYFVDAELRLNAVDVSLSPRVEIGVPKPLGIPSASRRGPVL